MKTIQTDLSLTSFESLGIFADFRIPTDEQYALMVSCGFDEVILTLAPHDIDDEVWSPLRESSIVIDAMHRALVAGLQVHLMLWVHRSSRFLNEALPELCTVAKAGRASTVLLDAEKHWHSPSQDGYGLTRHAGADLAEQHLDGLTWGVTGLGGRMPPSLIELCKRAHYVVPQAYSVWRPDKPKHSTHSKSTFPGHLQRKTLSAWTNGVFGSASSDVYHASDQWNRSGKRFIMGNACYWGKRPKQAGVPKLSQTQTMRIAFIETAALGVRHSWVWSFKHLKRRSSPDVRRFFGVED